MSTTKTEEPQGSMILEPEYITLEDFSALCGRKVSTIKKRYDKIPGVEKFDGGYRVQAGTRYPFAFARYNLESSANRRFILLKAISKYEYISHNELKLSQEQFQKMLDDFEEKGLISRNEEQNPYGANAYDCTEKGDEWLRMMEKKGLEQKAEIIGKFFGAALPGLVKIVIPDED